MTASIQDLPAQLQRRKFYMDTLNLASKPELSNTLDRIADLPTYRVVRTPQRGLMMVRGRIGGSGKPFNLGEVTVARASVSLDDGTVGHSCVLGTDKKKAEWCALFDACMQSELDSLKPAQVHIDKLVSAINERVETETQHKNKETAETKVDFFTMTRGDNG